MFDKIKRIHLVGIGGAGMSGIAEVLLSLGYEVSGSDLKETEITRRLSSLGGDIHIGHKAELVLDKDVVVISSAITNGNVEVKRAKEEHIPVIPRAEMLAELMRLRNGIAVTGAHGKTTTTSMIGAVLTNGGLDPTIVIGGRFKNIASHAKHGNGKFFVAEADESDGSFLKLSPIIAVVTNIDAEHLDYYQGGLAEIKENFVNFINKVPFYGCAILCLDDEHICSILDRIQRPVITYGLHPEAEIRGFDFEFEGTLSRFTVARSAEVLGQIEISLPGLHYIRDSLAAVTVGLELGLDFKTIKEGMSNYQGVDRRLQIKAEIGGVLLLDDYAHHPTEIKATLNSIKIAWPQRRRLVLFQPHRYTRSRCLAEEFGKAFEQADMVMVNDIYAAGETPIPGVSGEMIAAKIKQGSPNSEVEFISDPEQMVTAALDRVKSNDILITLGAGDIWMVGERILEELRKADCGMWMGKSGWPVAK
ncbi:MAG: UDP-N-acetylmuramate--L-alanine ligase [bacterium]